MRQGIFNYLGMRGKRRPIVKAEIRPLKAAKGQSKDRKGCVECALRRRAILQPCHRNGEGRQNEGMDNTPRQSSVKSVSQQETHADSFRQYLIYNDVHMPIGSVDLFDLQRPVVVWKWLT